MMRQHESRRVVGWIRTPPALPIVVGPWTADRPKHIAAKDESAKPVHRTARIFIINTARAAAFAEHCLEGARADEPRVQLLPTLAERIFKTLLRSCSETVKRNGKACNAHFRHSIPSPTAKYCFMTFSLAKRQRVYAERFPENRAAL